MDSAVTRILPSSLEAEQSVVGAMIMDTTRIDDVSEIITAEDFYNPQYGVIFQVLIELKNAGRQIDLVTLLDALKVKSAPAQVCDAGFLSELAGSVPFTANVRDYADIIKRKSLLRNIIKTNQEIQQLCYEENMDVEEILDLTESNLMSIIQQRGAGEVTSIDKVVGATLEKIERAYNNKGAITGISTGFDDLDMMTSGLQNSEMILVAARPSMGKTAFALTIAANVAFKQDIPVVIFSLEMSKESLMQRFFSIEAGIDATKLRDGTLSDYDWPLLMDSAERISNSKLIIDESPEVTVSEIRSRCRKYKQQNDIKLIIIDYLGLIRGNGRSESKQQEISEISRSLKGIARELDVPIICISQLNRGAEQREDKRPMLSDLRDSGAIEQDADVVMLIYRDDYYNKDSPDKGISEIILAKQRNGPTGTVQLAWLDRYTRFDNRRHARNTIQKD